MSAKKVLVVDDEASIREMLRLALEISDFECLEAADIHEAYRLITDESPDMVLLDWMLPGGSGIELLRRLKKEEATQALPVIMLTAKTHEDNVVQGLEVGADDYITKPFSQRLLIERIRAVLRRTKARNETAAAGEKKQNGDDDGNVMVRGRLTLDGERHDCFWQGAGVSLTVTEFMILDALARRPGVVKSRDQLMDAAYDDQIYVDDRTIDSHIKRLRRKFRQVDKDFDAIETLYGVGYKFKEVS